MESYFEKKSPFRSTKYRKILMGIDLSVLIAQVMVFLLLQQSAKNGDLPYYIVDLVIVVVAAAVAILAPFVSWIGSVNRRRTKFIWGSIGASCLILFFFIPITETPGSEYCAVTGTLVNRASSNQTAARLALLIISAIIVSLSGVALWNHGVAYMYENNPKINMHLGILIVVKVGVLSLAYLLIKDMTLGSKLWFQASLTIVGLVVNLFGLLCSPEEEQRITDDEQGFLTSMQRVLSNRLTMTLIISMSIFCAGLWGFSYNNIDILRTKYLYQEPNNPGYTVTTMFSFHFVVGIIVCYISTVTKSLPLVFDRVGTLKTILQCLIVISIMYLPQGLTYCEKGNVAGLMPSAYVTPLCSSRCGCNNPTVELNAVCIVEEMTTYLSPCHAGCSRVENIEGISVLANCTCGGIQQRAVRGACNAVQCRDMVALHNILCSAIAIFGVIVLKNYFVMVLESVDARDKSVALGVATTFVYFFTFICGQIAYFFIGESTCLWNTNGVCQIHKDNFPLYISMTSLGLNMTAVIITIITIVVIKKRS